MSWDQWVREGGVAQQIEQDGYSLAACRTGVSEVSNTVVVLVVHFTGVNYKKLMNMCSVQAGNLKHM